jgi:uncharacterized protein (TIGR02246 family)
MSFGRLTKLNFLLVAISLATSSAIFAQAPAAGSADAAIKDRVSGFIKAYNSRVASNLSEYFTDDATLVDVDGGVVRGKADISAQFANGFAQSSKFVLDSTIESIRYITPDVAQLEGVSTLNAPNEAAISNRFVTLVVKKDNVWKLAEIRDLPSPPDEILPADRLKELEWMIGDWVDQRGDLKIHSTVKWGENNAYITRVTTVSAGDENSHSSLMVLCFDPQSDQIRSWLFDSEGGRGEATWTRTADDQWVLRAAGCLRNGLPNSATQIVTVVGKDAIKTSSIDRIIGGEVAPDSDEILMVRKAPAVGDAAGAAGSPPVSVKPAAPVAPVPPVGAKPAVPAAPAVKPQGK